MRGWRKSRTLTKEFHAVCDRCKGWSLRKTRATTANEHANWTGDESIQDAVLRMLVDKYKPLRSGTLQSADQKLKRAPPAISSAGTYHGEFSAVSEETKPSSSKLLQPSTGSWATESLLPSTEGHRPWHTEFKVPSHVSASVKVAYFPLTSSGPSASMHSVDELTRKKEKEAKKRVEHVGRLSRARESTLDYRLGIKKGSEGMGRRPNPVSMKGWAALVEDKIEKARVSGVFNTVKGRGQPMARTVEESNPFIGREEFLMNRIVQRNGAAPPWVELQGELDIAVQSFRELLRQSWIRQTLRNLTTNHPVSILAQFTVSDVKRHRDPDWEMRERTYHDAAVEEVNALVRKYNGLAPYAVRRPYYNRSVEIGMLYENCADDIVKQLAERVKGGQDGGTPGYRSEAEAHHEPGEMVKRIRFRDLFLAWWYRLLGRWNLH
ncbi:uncharacterized protein EV420DRAFT_1622809 [Desarmillaria tabescens]|uniref:DnaJ homologue subfamily C member 28 conserved domain-containing protein n=1 Tax=Armillaria tabescens TaxID=1929756 RepID=A0AA39JKG6_ARMTA|nr:uncharacterized protein EV420DRAFT_1622809 [Desarmillaria tabescens]KAK0443877.1 hypothetical protein EV420DRAFT_1622809 [Desarmillaria tabescens]